ncbi:MAG: glycosyltransferase family 39 protein [Planctomycetes bacterium]|nr:glycosyltransferase family 39 protein [Planctomycetota bacterium]
MRTAERAVLVSIVVVIAAALRIGFVVGADVQAPLRADAGQYAQYAHNLVAHGVYSLDAGSAPAPDSFRSPGYPLLLAACRLLAGDGWYTLARWLQVALSTATVLLTYLLARRFLAFVPALAAAALTALSPHLVVSPAFVLTECLTVFVVVAALWALAGDGPRSRALPATLGGALLLGALPLCNETLVFLPAVVVVALWRGDRRRAVTVLLVSALPFAAWSLRNQLTPMARSGGERAVASISHGSYPGMVWQDPASFGFPYREDPAQPQMAASWHDLFAVLGPRVAAEPLRYAKWYLLDKPVWLWSWPLVQGQDVNVYPVGNSPYERQPVMAATHWLMHVLHAPVMLLALCGALASLRARRRAAHWAPFALGAAALLGTCAYLPVIPDPRYLQPFRPLLFVLAAGAAPSLVRAWQARASGRRSAAATAS